MKLTDLVDDTCAWCGKPFETTRSDKKYCSMRCRNKFNHAPLAAARRKARAGRKCPQCKRTFDARRADAKFCSALCRDKSNKIFKAEVAAEEVRRRRAGRKCRRCGVSIESMGGQAVYCGMPCYRKDYSDMKRANAGLPPRAETLATLACHECGTPLVDALRTTKKYCDSCRRKVIYRSNRKSLARHHPPLPPPTLACEHCGTKFDRGPRRNRRFCSTKCQQAGFYARRKVFA